MSKMLAHREMNRLICVLISGTWTGQVCWSRRSLSSSGCSCSGLLSRSSASTSFSSVLASPVGRIARCFLSFGLRRRSLRAVCSPCSPIHWPLGACCTPISNTGSLTLRSSISSLSPLITLRSVPGRSIFCCPLCSRTLCDFLISTVQWSLWKLFGSLCCWIRTRQRLCFCGIWWQRFASYFRQFIWIVISPFESVVHYTSCLHLRFFSS